jgi:hypothetical protein
MCRFLIIEKDRRVSGYNVIVVNVTQLLFYVMLHVDNHLYLNSEPHGFVRREADEDLFETSSSGGMVGGVGGFSGGRISEVMGSSRSCISAIRFDLGELPTGGAASGLFK